MDEKDWLILKLLHQHRSITKTAAAVHISQPALSKRLRQIEDRFGTGIALRNQTGIELTPAGEYLAQCAVDMLEKMHAMQEYIDNLGTEVKGCLRIGASFFVTKYALPDLLMRFKERYPQVEFHLTSTWSSDIIRMVANGQLHIGFVRNNSSMLQEKYLLFQEKTYICSKKELDLARLPDEPRISYNRDAQVRADLDAWWADHYSKPPLIAMVVDRVDTSVVMVERGLGYAFLSEYSVKQMRDIHTYLIRHKNGEPYCRNTWVVPNRDAKQLQMVRCFLDFVRRFRFSNTFESLHPVDSDR